MEFWNNATSTTKAIIVIAVVAVLALLLIIILALAGVFSGSGGGATPTTTPIVEGGGPAPTPQPGVPMLAANSTANVRSGPGTDYPRVGILQVGQTAEIIGKSQDGGWWVIKYPGVPNDQGWIAAELVTASNAQSVPIVQAPVLPTPTPVPPMVFEGWRAEYFANRDLSGQPAVTRDEASLNFDWGTNPPAPGMPGENWSARYTITRDMPAGTYRFSIWVDDGMRLFVDDALIVDGWREGQARNFTADVNITRGTHTIRVEYFQAAGSALLQLEFGYVASYTDWKAEYFSNANVEGAPVVVRNDPEINFNWGNGSPAPGVPADNYSVRWSRKYFFEEGNFVFNVSVAGGVRLWLDGRLLIDDWRSDPLRQLQAESGVIGRGDHDLRVDYFKLTGAGQITVNWEPMQPAGPPAAVIGGPRQAQVGETVSFDGSESTAAEGSEIVVYNWDFGDGVSAAGALVSHAYSTAGAYQVTLTVVDDKSLQNSTSIQMQVSEAAATPPPAQPPVASIIGPSQGQVGEPLNFDGSASTGVAPIVSYRWTFGDGATAEGVNVAHTFNAEGLFDVSLTVADEGGLESTATTQVEIIGSSVQPPVESPIAGTIWALQSYADGQGGQVALLPDTQIAIAFRDTGTVEGSAGCNTYSGTYEANAGQLTISSLTTSRLACAEPAGIMEQEAAYLAALPAASRYEIASERLTLFDANNQAILVYGPAAVPF